MSIIKKYTLEYLILHSDKMENLEYLYKLVRVPVYNYALSILKDPVLAQDILQEVILKIHKNHTSYKKGNSLSWILTITKNESLMCLRKNKKQVDIDDEFWSNIPTEEKLDVNESILLKTLITNLNDEEREIVTLIAIVGYKNKEVAKYLNIPLGTVLSKYNRAIKKMQNSLKKEGI